MAEGHSGTTHIAALDGVRGVAILVVVLSHLAIPGFYGGGIGVDIFFVLSGFLITSIVCREISRTGRLDFNRFFAKRALRLLPALVIAMGAAFVLNDESFWNLLAAGLYFMDLRVASGADTGVIGHTWSLAVEEHYYMAWPVIALLALKRVPPMRLAAYLMISWIGATLYYVAGEARAVGWEALSFRTDYRLSGLILGSALALFVSAGGRIAAPGRWALIVLPGVVYWLAYPSGGLILKHGVTEIFTALIILAVMQAEKLWTAPLSFPVLTYLGRISYGLYLYHLIALKTLSDEGGLSAHLTIMAGVVVFTMASFHLIERPILRWGHDLLAAWRSGVKKARAVAVVHGTQSPLEYEQSSSKIRASLRA